MFNKEKIQALEQSVATLTEELTKANEVIESLYKDLERVMESVDKIQYEKEGLVKTFGDYTLKVSEEFTNLDKKYTDENNSLKDEVESLRKYIGELADNYSSADEEHNNQLAALKQSTDNLVKKCEDIQLSNVQVMNQHNDMIKRYEQSIKGYAEQTQIMKNNILKKMNANNIISIVED